MDVSLHETLAAANITYQIKNRTIFFFTRHFSLKPVKAVTLKEEQPYLQAGHKDGVLPSTRHHHHRHGYYQRSAQAAYQF